MQHFILDAERRVVQTLLAWGRWVGTVGSLESHGRSWGTFWCSRRSPASISVLVMDRPPSSKRGSRTASTNSSARHLRPGRSPWQARGPDGTVERLGRRLTGGGNAGARGSVRPARFGREAGDSRGASYLPGRPGSVLKAGHLPHQFPPPAARLRSRGSGGKRCVNGRLELVDGDAARDLICHGDLRLAAGALACRDEGDRLRADVVEVEAGDVVDEGRARPGRSRCRP